MYPVTVLLNVLVQLLVFMSDLAVLLFSIVLIDSPRGGKKGRGTNFLLRAFFNTRQKLVDFFTYIRPKEGRSRPISYNSVCLILACNQNFAATVTLIVSSLPV